MKLRLAGHEWTVERASFDDRWDETDPAAYTIRIADKAKGSKLAENLIHESIHAIEVEYGLDFSEREVRALALGLHQMLAPFLKVKGI